MDLRSTYNACAATDLSSLTVCNIAVCEGGMERGLETTG